LLQEIFIVAREQGCQRLRWQVLDWNTSAIDIYRRKGANISAEWLNCDFFKDEIANFPANMDSLQES
jgi:hypothetical protein